MSQRKDGSWTGNRQVKTRIPKAMQAAFDAKCKKLGLNESECLRLAVKEFSESK